MTEQTQPTDAEILDAADDFRSQYKHGGTTFDEFNALGFARAVLAKWGTPAGAGEVVSRSVAVNLARNAIEQYDCKGITTKGIHTLCTALLAMDAQLSAGRPDGTRDQKTWCSYVAGMIATYLRKDADGAEAAAIAGIIERRLMFLLPTTPQPTQAQAGAVPTRAFLERTLAAMEGVIDVADRKTDEFDALRSCVIDLTLMLFKPGQSGSTAPSAKLPREVIRDIFMAHGFTIKEGQTDLKQYVYDAADALLRAAHGIKGADHD